MSVFYPDPPGVGALISNCMIEKQTQTPLKTGNKSKYEGRKLKSIFGGNFSGYGKIEFAVVFEDNEKPEKISGKKMKKHFLSQLLDYYESHIELSTIK